MLDERLIGMLTESEHLPDPLPADPLPLFHTWFAQAQGIADTANPDAMVLSTVDANGHPDSRVVLCKSLDIRTGSLVFFTNLAGTKAAQLAHEPRAAALFHWDRAGRQVRLRGPTARATDAESDAYFASRPTLAKLGAWASDQSRPMRSPVELFGRVLETMARFQIAPDQLSGPAAAVPRPPHWGGVRLWIESIELWCGGAGRLHDRARWTRSITLTDGGDPRFTPWAATRLFP